MRSTLLIVFTCFGFGAGAACDDASTPATSQDAASDTTADASPDATGDVTHDATPDTTGDDATDTADAAPANGYPACFPHLVEALNIDYDVEGAVVDNCSGTNQQDITDIERFVVLGDSISAGTGAPAGQTYADRLEAMLIDDFGADLQVDSCAKGGAVNASLMQSQIPTCFPEDVHPERTLVVFTSGGNDLASMAFTQPSVEAGKAEVEGWVDDLREALAFFDDPVRFPNGVFVVFANVYEFTDGTANMDTCPLGVLTGQWDPGRDVFVHAAELYLDAAVEFGFDVIFMGETFCGHGYGAELEESPCHDVAGDLWFSFDCIHPNPTGHGVIADMFHDVISN